MDTGEFYHAIPATVSGNDIPLGMGVELAKNLSALGVFAGMSPEDQRAVIARAQSVTTEAEMAALVASLNAQG